MRIERRRHRGRSGVETEQWVETQKTSFFIATSTLWLAWLLLSSSPRLALSSRSPRLRLPPTPSSPQRATSRGLQAIYGPSADYCGCHTPYWWKTQKQAIEPGNCPLMIQCQHDEVIANQARSGGGFLCCSLTFANGYCQSSALLSVSVAEMCLPTYFLSRNLGSVRAVVPCASFKWLNYFSYMFTEHIIRVSR